jgi:hypothetical protein
MAVACPIDLDTVRLREEVQVRERFDPFHGTSKEKVARKYRVAGVNVHAAKRAREVRP